MQPANVTLEGSFDVYLGSTLHPVTMANAGFLNFSTKTCIVVQG